MLLACFTLSPVSSALHVPACVKVACRVLEQTNSTGDSPQVVIGSDTIVDVSYILKYGTVINLEYILFRRKYLGFRLNLVSKVVSSCVKVASWG